MVSVPLARFAPDKAKFNTDALSNVSNAIPATDGWKPLKQIVTTPAIYDYLVDQDGNRITDEDGNRLIVGTDWSGIVGDVALPDTATMFFVARKRDGSEVLFAGTETALVKYNTVSNVWEDVSSTTYASEIPWIVVQDGDLVLAQNGFDVEQKFDVENDTEFSDNSTAPICKAMAVAKGFVWRGNIVSWASEGYTNEPRMVMCSAYNDPTDNVLQNRNFCDMQIYSLGTQVQALVPFGEGIIVEMQDGKYPVSVVMGDYTFASGDFIIGGTPAPYSVGIVGSNDYFIYRDDGFWRLNAGGPRNIGNEKVNQFFLEDCDQEQRETIRACVDPENNVCWWSYTDTSGDRKMIGIHYLIEEWTTSDLDVVVASAARTFEYSTAITTAGLLRFAVINSDGILGYLVGPNARAEFGTNEVLHSPSRSWVNGLRLITDASTYSVIVSTRDVLGGTLRARSSATPSARSGFVPSRADGRAHKYDFLIDEDTDWTTASIVDVDVKASGRS